MSTETADQIIDRIEWNQGDEEFSTFAYIRDLKGTVPGDVFAEVAQTFDLCPVHVCDMAICLDDDRSCTRR